MTTNPSRGPSWPLVVLAIVGLIACAPFLLAALGIGLALTLGLAAILLKFGVVVLVVWAAVMLLKGIFGGGHKKPSTEVLTAPRVQVNPAAELEREDRERKAALDRELELAIARKNAGSGTSPAQT